MKTSQPIHTTLWTSIVLLMSLPGFAAQEETPNVIPDTTMIIKTQPDSVHVKMDTIKGDSNVTNWALRFDGTNDVVNCGDMDALKNVCALTIEMWVNIEKFSPWRTFFAKRTNDYDRIQFQEYSIAGDIGIAISANKVLGYYHTISKPVTIGDWFHLAMVYDGTKEKSVDRLKVYINGREVEIAPHKGEAVTSKTPDNTAPILLGAEKADGSWGYAGTMDEVRLWNVARTSDDVIGDMRTSISKSSPGLVAFWNFDEGKGAVLVDSMGKQNGTIDNFALTGPTSNWIPREYVKPSVAAKSITITSSQAKSLKLSWVCGSGAYRAVFLKKGTDGFAVPGDMITFKAGPFEQGSQIGDSGWFCVYNGPACNTEITGLSIATEYVAHVIEYNGVPGKEHYVTTPSQGNPMRIQTALVADKPQKNCSILHVDSIGISTVTISLQTGEGEGRAIFITSDTLSSYPDLVDNADFKANSSFGNGDSIGVWKCVFNGSGNSVEVEGLTPVTQYRVVAFEKNGHDQYTAWLNENATDTSFVTSAPPQIVSTIQTAPIASPPVAPAPVIAPPTHRNLLFFYGAGGIGAVALGIIVMLIANGGHHGTDTPAADGHDLGTPPINPSTFVH